MNKFILFLTISIVNVLVGAEYSPLNSQLAAQEFINQKFNTLLSSPLQTTKIIGFAETHNDLIANQNIQDLINMLSKKNAVLLIEGIEQEKIVDVEQLKANKHIVLKVPTIIKGWDDLSSKEEFIKTFKENSRRYIENPNQSLLDFGFEKDLITRNASMIKTIANELDNQKFVYVIFGKNHYLGREQNIQSVEPLRNFFKNNNALILEPKKFEQHYSPIVEEILKKFGNRININYSQFNLTNPSISFKNFSPNELNIQTPILIKQLNPQAISLNNIQIDHKINDPLLQSIMESNITVLIIIFSEIDCDQTIMDIIANAPKTLQQMRITDTNIQKRSYTDSDLINAAKAKNINLQILYKQ